MYRSVFLDEDFFVSFIAKTFLLKTRAFYIVKGHMSIAELDHEGLPRDSDI